MKENYLGNGGTIRGKQRPDYNVKNTTTSIDDFYMVELYPPDILEEGETLKLEAQSMDGCILLFSKDGEPYLVAGVYRDGEIKSAGYHLIAEPQYKKQFCGYDWLHMGRMMYYVFNGKLIAHNVRPKWLTQYPVGLFSCERWSSLTESYWLFYSAEDYFASPTIAHVPRIGNLLFTYNALIPMQEEPKEISKHEWFGNVIQFEGFFKMAKTVMAGGAVYAPWEWDTYRFFQSDAIFSHEGALYYGEQLTGVFSRAYLFPSRFDFTEDPKGRITSYSGVISSSPGVYGMNYDNNIRCFFHAGDGLIIASEHSATFKTGNDVKMIAYSADVEGLSQYDYCAVELDSTEQDVKKEVFESFGVICSSVFPHGSPKIIDVHSEYDANDSGVTASWGVDRNGGFVQHTGFISPDFNSLKANHFNADYLAGCTYGMVGHRSGLSALLTQLAPPFHRMSIPGVNPRVISEKEGISARSVIKNSMRVTDLQFKNIDGKPLEAIDHSPIPEKVFLNPVTVNKICCGVINTEFTLLADGFPILIWHPSDADDKTHYAWILPSGEIDETKIINTSPYEMWTSPDRNTLYYGDKKIPIHPDWVGWWGETRPPDTTGSGDEFKKLSLGISMQHKRPLDNYMGPTLFNENPKQGCFGFRDTSTAMGYKIVDTELYGMAEDIAVAWAGSGWSRQQQSYSVRYYSSYGVGMFPLIMSRGSYTDRLGNQRSTEHIFIFLTLKGANIPNYSGRRWTKSRLAMYRIDKNPELEDHIFEERRW